MENLDYKELFESYSNNGVLNFEEYKALQRNVEYNIRKEFIETLHECAKSTRDCYENVILYLQYWEEIDEKNILEAIQLYKSGLKERTILGHINKDIIL